MSNTYFTSDIHFGHVNILNYCADRRRYLGLNDAADVSDMNEALVSLWNDQVTEGDTVYILGDLCMGKVAETLTYVERLKGEKFLIPGNHDRMHPIMHRNDAKTAEWVSRYTDVGLTVFDIGPHRWYIDGIWCDVSHFPHTGDHTEDPRYLGWRPENTGRPLVHGHVHDLWQTEGAQYNVGIDAWGGVFRTESDIGTYFRSLGIS